MSCSSSACLGGFLPSHCRPTRTAPPPQPLPRAALVPYRAHLPGYLVQYLSRPAGFSSQPAPGALSCSVPTSPGLGTHSLTLLARLCQAQVACTDSRAKMSSIFAYQSSEVDWCESNFQHSELVAEFYNTVRAWAGALARMGWGRLTECWIKTQLLRRESCLSSWLSQLVSIHSFVIM